VGNGEWRIVNRVDWETGNRRQETGRQADCKQEIRKSGNQSINNQVITGMEVRSRRKDVMLSVTFLRTGKMPGRLCQMGSLI
jgi:hypothetical protein